MSTSRTREKADGELFKSTGIDDNATSTAVTIDASENVGVGVAVPTKKLDVYGEAQISWGGVDSYLYYQSASNYTGRKTDGNMWMNAAGSQADDYSAESAEVQAICVAVHTDEIVAQYQAHLEESTP